MAAQNFQRSLDLVFSHEGGYVDHPKDPGGATNLGITLKTLSGFRGRTVSKQDVRNLTRDEAAQIYRLQYWNPIKGNDLAPGVDFAVFDYTVNSGAGRAIKDLQRVVGVTPDGAFGLQTLAAVNAMDPRKVINALCDRRLAFLKSLTTWKTFGKGWQRRVDGVRREALAAVGKIGQSLAMIPAGVVTPKADPSDQRVTATTGGKGVTTSGLGLLGTTMSEAASTIEPLAMYADVLKWVFLALVLAGIGITLYSQIKRIEAQ